MRPLLVLTALASLGCTRPARETPPAEVVVRDSTVGGVHQDRRFAGYVRIRAAGGTDSVRVELLNLDLHGRTTLDRLELPFEGTVVAYIQSGSASVIINGKREERSEGQIWTVPPGASLGFATASDAVSLQLVVVGRGGP